MDGVPGLEALPNFRRIEYRKFFEDHESIFGSNPNHTILLESYLKHEFETGDNKMSNIINEYFNKNLNEPALIGPLPQKASTATECMDIVPLVESNLFNVPDSSSHNDDLNQALYNSVAVSHSRHFESVETPEQMQRNEELTTGLANTHNNCWFNCLAQMLYSIPKLRSFLYHSIPCTWETLPITNVEKEKKMEAEFLYHLRKLFARMQFSEKKFVKVPMPMLKTMEALYRANPHSQKKSILQSEHQDASEMLMGIMEWLTTGIDAAIFAFRNPNYHIDDAENMVVGDSVSAPSTSDMSCPPPYTEQDFTQPSTSTGIPPSRPNTPSKGHIPIDPPDFVGKDDAMEIDESPRDNFVFAAPGAKTSPVTKAFVAVSPEESARIEEKVNEINRTFDEIFKSEKVACLADGSQLSEPVVAKPDVMLLTVQYGNLHDAIEDTTFKEQIKKFETFESLPGTIFFSLSRYINGTLNSEKVNNQFTFPREIYMDRYMKENLETIVALRQERESLREQLSAVRALMKGIREFPQKAGGYFSLTELFEVVLNVVETIDSGVPPQDINGPVHNAEEKMDFVKDLGIICPALPHDPKFAMKIKERLDTLRDQELGCIRRQHELERKIESMFDVDHMKRMKYDLHAVICHTGNVNGGHYFMYKVKNFPDGRQVWEKVNDSLVEQVEWEQVVKDGYGTGQKHDPSAYILMYLKSDADWLMAQEKMTVEEARTLLPTDIKDFVDKEWKKTREELKKFRERSFQSSSQNGFGWYHASNGDENANPQPVISEDLVARLDSYDKDFDFPKFLLIEKVDSLWNMINRIAPERHLSKESLVQDHYKYMMIDGLDALKQSSGPKVDYLTSTTENDTANVINEFIKDYVHDTNSNNYNTNFIRYVIHKVANQITGIPFLRYLLLSALVVDKTYEVVSKAAAAEIAASLKKLPDGMNHLSRLAALWAHLYEMECITAWACRLSLEKSIPLYDDNFFGVESESSYIALLAAKIARVAREKVRKSLDFAVELPDLFLIPDDLIVYVAVVATVTTAKLFLSCITMRSENGFERLSFHLKYNDRRVEKKVMVEELVEAMVAIVLWSNEPSIDIHSISPDERAYREKRTADQPHTLKAIFLVMQEKFNRICETPGCDERKFGIASRLAVGCQNPPDKITPPNMQYLKDIKCNPNAAPVELAEISQRISSFGLVTDKLNVLMEKCEKLVEDYRNPIPVDDYTSDRLSPPYM